MARSAAALMRESGFDVQLFDTNGSEIPVGADGILGTADDATGGVVTNSNGIYFFNGLAPGEYQVVIPESNFSAGSVLERIEHGINGFTYDPYDQISMVNYIVKLAEDPPIVIAVHEPPVGL